MADEPKARPVSGEIMAGNHGSAREARAPGSDIIDADYEIVRPRTRPAAEPSAPAIASPAAPLGGMGMLRPAEERPKPATSSRGGPAFWLYGLGLVVGSFWVSGGHALVRNAVFPSEQPRALSIVDVTSRVDASGPNPLLFVDGKAANDGSGPEMLPPLEIVVTDNEGRTTRYRLGTSGRSVAPGERFAFSSRLGVPKNGVKTVSVIFAE